MFELADIDFERAGRHLLHRVRIEVAPGEVVALIGPNGAGKSTLLHVLSGALTPGAGEVCLDGVPLAQWAWPELARRRAVLPQVPELGFPLTVRDVVALGRSPHAGTSDRRTDACIVGSALEETGIGHLAQRLYPTLSGGERQRAQLARVLAQVWPDDGSDRARARYLFLDEPTNNLDIAYQEHVLEAARRFAGRGNGVVAVLHEPNLAARHADRIVVLVDGEIIANGSPGTVLTEDLVHDAFGVRATIHTHPASGRPYMLPA